MLMMQHWLKILQDLGDIYMKVIVAWLKLQAPV
jgi:hypothetical protein